MTKQEAAIAFAQGKPVEWSWGDGHWFTADAFRYFDLEGTQYRLKPVPVPPGDLTYEEACECIRRHEPVQYCDYDGHWKDSGANLAWSVSGLSPYVAYRRKLQPKRVPLGPEDVPPGSAIRYKHGTECTYRLWCVVSTCCDDGVYNEGRQLTFLRLMEDYEISRDGGKTWEPCWKEVEE